MSSMSITVVGEKVEGQQVSDTTTGLELFGDDKTIVAVRVNGELRDLSRPLLDGINTVGGHDGADSSRSATPTRTG